MKDTPTKTNTEEQPKAILKITAHLSIEGMDLTLPPNMEDQERQLLLSRLAPLWSELESKIRLPIATFEECASSILQVPCTVLVALD